MPLRIAAADGDQPVDVEVFRNPSGLISATIDRAELLQLDAEGGLRVGLLVSDTESQDSQNARWKIDDLRLTVEGQVQ